MTENHQSIGNSRGRPPLETEENSIESANLHINGACNYDCIFCFARNLVQETTTPDEWEPILRSLKTNGITKVNFAGGEPTLHPQFIQLCELSKKIGFTVSVVTNGSKIDERLMRRMRGCVDWIGLSVDSPENEVEKQLGRQCKGVDHIQNVISVAKMAKENGIKVKLNITVVRQSWNQDFSDLIQKVSPARVKGFQVLRIEGENDDRDDECSITEEEWTHFVRNHEDIVLSNGERIVFEGGCDMIDSYLMLDPKGQIIKNTGNKQSFVPHSVITAGGFSAAVDVEKYHRRGAVYDWGASQ